MLFAIELLAKPNHSLRDAPSVKKSLIICHLLYTQSIIQNFILLKKGSDHHCPVTASHFRSFFVSGMSQRRELHMWPRHCPFNGKWWTPPLYNTIPYSFCRVDSSMTMLWPPYLVTPRDYNIPVSPWCIRYYSTFIPRKYVKNIATFLAYGTRW